MRPSHLQQTQTPSLLVILCQGSIGKGLPIAYASRKLRNEETKYSAIECALLAIAWSVKQFRRYLSGRKFELIMAHSPSRPILFKICRLARPKRVKESQTKDKQSNGSFEILEIRQNHAAVGKSKTSQKMKDIFERMESFPKS